MEFPSIDTTVKFSKVCHLIVFQVIWENIEHFAVIEQLKSIIFISQVICARHKDTIKNKV